MTQGKLQESLQSIIEQFEIERTKCHDEHYAKDVKSHQEHLEGRSGLINEPTPRNQRTCQNSCPTEYGETTCYVTPDVHTYENAKEFLEIVEAAKTKFPDCEDEKYIITTKVPSIILGVSRMVLHKEFAEAMFFRDLKEWFLEQFGR